MVRVIILLQVDSILTMILPHSLEVGIEAVPARVVAELRSFRPEGFWKYAFKGMICVIETESGHSEVIDGSQNSTSGNNRGQMFLGHSKIGCLRRVETEEQGGVVYMKAKQYSVGLKCFPIGYSDDKVPWENSKRGEVIRSPSQGRLWKHSIIVTYLCTTG